MREQENMLERGQSQALRRARRDGGVRHGTVFNPPRTVRRRLLALF
ncbi:MAG: hypothetical protein ABI352_05570 [Candidatus Dormibacter sp.]